MCDCCFALFSVSKKQAQAKWQQIKVACSGDNSKQSVIQFLLILAFLLHKAKEDPFYIILRHTSTGKMKDDINFQKSYQTHLPLQFHSVNLPWDICL